MLSTSPTKHPPVSWRRSYVEGNEEDGDVDEEEEKEEEEEELEEAGDDKVC